MTFFGHPPDDKVSKSDHPASEILYYLGLPDDRLFRTLFERDQERYNCLTNESLYAWEIVVLLTFLGHQSIFDV